MVGLMEYRVDLYAAEAHRDTVPVDAGNEVDAVTTARSLVVARGVDRARVWLRLDAGRLQHVAWVEADR